MPVVQEGALRAARAHDQTDAHLLLKFRRRAGKQSVPRYYFHIRSVDDVALDEEGTNLPDLSAARRLALASARELLGIAIKEGGRIRAGGGDGGHQGSRAKPSACLESPGEQTALIQRCADDVEASEAAKQLVDGHDVELWQRDRMVAKFEHRPKDHK
jgi:hypothetical protein